MDAEESRNRALGHFRDIEADVVVLHDHISDMDVSNGFWNFSHCIKRPLCTIGVLVTDDTEYIAIYKRLRT